MWRCEDLGTSYHGLILNGLLLALDKVKLLIANYEGITGLGLFDGLIGTGDVAV